VAAHGVDRLAVSMRVLQMGIDVPGRFHRAVHGQVAQGAEMTPDAQGIVFVLILVVVCGILASAYSKTGWLQ
jgi:hypothetical protein